MLKAALRAAAWGGRPQANATTGSWNATSPRLGIFLQPRPHYLSLVREQAVPVRAILGEHRAVSRGI
jgi:hypothetical protein